MKKKLLILLLSLSAGSAFSQFDFYASAIYLNQNGVSTFYYNTKPNTNQNIGNVIFNFSSLGSYPQNSGAFRVAGAEMKTFKGSSGNVCSATLFFTVYPFGQRPAAPVFTSVGLGFYANCDEGACDNFTNSFSLSKGGGCCSIGDQKWQYPEGGNGGGNNGDIDLTDRVQGNYTLEVYYQITGEANGNGCTESRYDNNASNFANYTATFTILAPLPVKFGSIAALKQPGGNRISWNTFTEENSKLFSIERSGDVQIFQAIGSTPAAGNSNNIKNYYFTDSKPLVGNNYYRVKMLENDGKKQYSSVVLASANALANTAVYPNPARGRLQVFNITPGSTINLYNSSGAPVYKGMAAAAQQSINVTAIPAGKYMLQCINTDGSKVIPVIINK